MKRILILVFVVTLATASLSAQCPLPVGGKQVNAGIGLSGWSLPVYAGFDVGVHRDITVGLEGSFRSYIERINHVNYTNSIIGITGNGNYHFNTLLDIPSQWDFYAGLNLGFYIWSSPADYPGTHASGIGLGGQVGGRYFLNKNFGLNLELGGGSTTAGGKFGITFIL